MTGKERIDSAMALETPDRVPLMCQLAIGHYFLYSGIDPLDIWFTSEGFAEALLWLCKRYHFDGILVNLPGREPHYQQHVQSIERKNREILLKWGNDNYTSSGICVAI